MQPFSLSVSLPSLTIESPTFVDALSEVYVSRWFPYHNFFDHTRLYKILLPSTYDWVVPETGLHDFQAPVSFASVEPLARRAVESSSNTVDPRNVRSASLANDVYVFLRLEFSISHRILGSRAPEIPVPSPTQRALCPPRLSFPVIISLHPHPTLIFYLAMWLRSREVCNYSMKIKFECIFNPNFI